MQSRRKTGDSDTRMKTLRSITVQLARGVAALVIGLPVIAVSQTTNTWVYTGSLNAARYSHTATLLPNGKVLVAGGWSVGGGDLAIGSAEV